MEVLCWLLLAAIFILFEIVSLGLTTIWFAGGTFVAAIVAACGANVPLQVLCFVVVSVLLLIFTRPIAVKHLDSKIEKTNAEALIDKNAVVLSDINNMESMGKVKVNGMEWTARAREDSLIIPKGETVRIVAIEGVKLIVDRLQKETGSDV